MDFASFVSEHISYEDMIAIKFVSSVVTQLIMAKQRLNMTTKEFADFLDIPIDRLIEWESCNHEFTISEIAYICKKLQITVDLDWSSAM